MTNPEHAHQPVASAALTPTVAPAAPGAVPMETRGVISPSRFVAPSPPAGSTSTSQPPLAVATPAKALRPAGMPSAATEAPAQTRAATASSLSQNQAGPMPPSTSVWRGTDAGPSLSASSAAAAVVSFDQTAAPPTQTATIGAPVAGTTPASPPAPATPSGAAPRSMQTPAAPASTETDAAPMSMQTAAEPASTQTAAAPRSMQTAAASTSTQTAGAPTSTQTVAAPTSTQTIVAAPASTQTAAATPPPAEPPAAMPPAVEPSSVVAWPSVQASASVPLLQGTHTPAAASPNVQSSARVPAAAASTATSQPPHPAHQIVLRATEDTWVRVFRQNGGPVLLSPKS